MPERSMALSIADVRALGDRLWARSQSRLLEGAELKSDLRIAARCLWALTVDYAPTEMLVIPAD